MLAKLETSVLVVVDMQPTFLNGIFERERVEERTKFIVEVARLLEVPVVATEQYPERMGGTDEAIAALLGREAMPKMTFSCCGIEPFNASLAGKKQVVLTGIETHICVNQTAHNLLDAGYDVIVCDDAVSARSINRHKVGLKRLRDAGMTLAHTESIAYEWAGSAEHPKFRDMLALVKNHQ